MPFKPATIPASQTRLLKSNYAKSQYRISISLPYAYFESAKKLWLFENPPKKWPVVYLTDSNWFFGMVTEIVRNMAWFGGTTDAIIVGIGYPDEREPQETLRTTIARRFYDLSPVRDEAFEKIGELLECPVPTGGASDFLNFIKNELIPAIEEDFRADPDKRILAGHSLGGTFTAFALLEEPELFDTYIIGSPALSYGSRFIFKAEELFAKRQKKLTARVHLWVGEREETTNDPGLSDVIRFGAILESHKYRGLTLIKQVFPDLAHSEVIAPGFQAGLKFALKKRARK